MITLFALVYTCGLGWIVGWPWWLNVILGLLYGAAVAYKGPAPNFSAYILCALYLFAVPVHFLQWPTWTGIVAAFVIGSSAAQTHSSWIRRRP
jgi:hypothetical protein